MKRNIPDEIVRGPRLDALRSQHPAFISEHIQTGPDLEMTRADLANAYAAWIGITERDRRGQRLRYSIQDVHNLFVLVRRLEGVTEDFWKKKFLGVGLVPGD